MTPIHVKGIWRAPKSHDWNINPDVEEKSSAGFVGLRNLGCTCYMNSVMQQFYMIPTFRAEILSIINPNKDEKQDESVLYQTQWLFSYLSESIKQYVDTKSFCHVIKNWERTSINAHL